MTEPLMDKDKLVEDVELRERVRDFIYDHTRDEFDTGWTLSAHQTDDLIEMVAAALRSHAQKEG